MLHAYDGSLRRVATAVATASNKRYAILVAATASELDTLENMLPDKEQRRIDNPDHQEGE